MFIFPPIFKHSLFGSQSQLQECWEAESDSDLLEELSINDDAPESLTRSSVLYQGEILARRTNKIDSNLLTYFGQLLLFYLFGSYYMHEFVQSVAVVPHF